MRISIITPLYNAEQTLIDSLSSIRIKDGRELELLLINDGSTDRTQVILDRFVTECPFSYNCIYQENQGAAAARNCGLTRARGDYLLFLDADDRFAPGALDQIINEISSGVDIVGWDMISEKKGKNRIIRQADYATPEEGLINLMGGTMKWNLWLFAIRRELVDSNAIHFIHGSDMGEDMAFILKCFACAKSVRQIHQALYKYNASNPASISVQLNERRRAEVSRNLESASAFLMTSTYADLYRKYLPHLKLFIKLPLLIGFSVDNYRIWFQWMKEANVYAMRNSDLPFRIRLLQGMASLKLWPSVWLYNCLYKFLLQLK